MSSTTTENFYVEVQEYTADGVGELCWWYYSSTVNEQEALRRAENLHKTYRNVRVRKEIQTRSSEIVRTYE